ncbi:uncharacterized protein HaLaN_21005, partial [Haematococcus lacustris]
MSWAAPFAQAGRRCYVTPTSYLELLAAFTTLLASKSAEVLAAQQRYEVGLQKLEFTAGQSFKNPPAAIKLVMEAVCVMLDAKPTMVADPNTPGKRNADYWDTGKRLLLDTYFINRLKEFDRDNIQ